MKLNIFISSIVLAGLPWCGVVADEIDYKFQLTSHEIKWLGEQIYSNECNANFECLTSWNSGEDFPSLGIGHFIWFRADQQSTFEETFPQLIEFMNTKNAPVPAWLNEESDPNSPWTSRENFYANFDSRKMKELRNFLAQQKALQVEFIVLGFNQTLNQIILDFPESVRPEIEDIIRTIISSQDSLGLYALIDYVHFKGTGLSHKERYLGHGWGLRQVLNEMLKKPVTLPSFVESAENVLVRRVKNAPIERNERQWLAGWSKRLQTYLPPVTGSALECTSI